MAPGNLPETAVHKLVTIEYPARISCFTSRHIVAGEEPAGMTTTDLKARAGADGVRFLLALFVDLTGKPCAKLVPVEAADELQHEPEDLVAVTIEAAAMARVPLAGTSWIPGAPGA